MYKLFSLVQYFLFCLFVLNVFAEHEEHDKCSGSCSFACPVGEIPAFCTNLGSKNDKTCVPDNRSGMEHGWWEVDYSKGYRCILRCNEGFIENGCHVQRTWIEEMPTCIEDTWSRFAKTAGKNTMKVVGVVGAGVAVGTAAVASVVPLLGVFGFGAAAIAAGTTGTAVIGTGKVLSTAAVTGALTAAFTGCESE